ncbi:MAG: efflux RND transporter periplasmic adaptor subunit, partial [Flavobacterium sp.]
MKTIKSIIASITLAFLCTLYSCEKKEEAKAETVATEKEEAHGENPNKEVELNEAQYSASDIELGTFIAKNLSEVVNANGYTKLPPQNQADVSVFVSGIVKSINVIEGQSVRKG